MRTNFNALDLTDDLFPLWVRKAVLLLFAFGFVFFRGPTTHLIGRLAQDKANEFVHEIQQGQPVVPTTPTVAPSPTTTRR